MLTSFWAAKGGVGCSTTALLVAAGARRSDGDVVVIDLGGDLLTMAGFGDGPGAGSRPGPGVTDWLASGAGADRVRRVEVECAPGLTIVPFGGSTDWPAERDELLGESLAGDRRTVIVDVGLVEPAGVGALARLRRRFASADGSVLVTRPCYVALRRALAADASASSVVVVREPGRSLDDRTIAEALGIGRVTRVDLDPRVARAVDDGTLVRRPPRVAVRQAARAVR